MLNCVHNRYINISQVMVSCVVEHSIQIQSGLRICYILGSGLRHAALGPVEAEAPQLWLCVFIDEVMVMGSNPIQKQVD